MPVFPHERQSLMKSATVEHHDHRVHHFAVDLAELDPKALPSAGGCRMTFGGTGAAGGVAATAAAASKQNG
jgi:hypothetical protein